jgi:hypothetical protein
MAHSSLSLSALPALAGMKGSPGAGFPGLPGCSQFIGLVFRRRGARFVEVPHLQLKG